MTLIDIYGIVSRQVWGCFMENNYFNNMFDNNIMLENFSDLGEKDIFSKIKNGDMNIREKFIKYNLRAVIYEVNKNFFYWQEQGVIEKEELLSVGIIGLIKAVDTFDVSRNYKFITYAITCIDNELKMFIRNMKKSPNALSLENNIYTDDEFDKTLNDILSDNYDFVEDIIKKEEYKIIDKIVDDLSFEERKIIRMYFGFDGKRYNQQELSKLCNVSQSYMSRVIRKILKKIENRLLEMEIYEEDILKKNKRRY